MKKTFIVLVLGLVICAPCNAQLSRALNGLKKGAAVNNESSVSVPQVDVSLNVRERNSPCPWVMEDVDEQTFRTRVDSFLDSIAVMTNSRPLFDFKQALLARAHEDSLEYNRLKDYWGKMSSEQYKAYGKLEQELDRFYTFLCLLGDQTVRFNFIGSTTLEGDKVACDFEACRFMTTNSSVLVRKDGSDQKWYFYEDNGDKTFLEGDDLNKVMEQIRRYFYVYYLMSGKDDSDLIKNAYTAQMCWAYGLEANGNNKPENITRHPYPKGGALNSISGAALASAKNNESYKNAVAVVIEADSWTIDYNALGTPVRRRVTGWVIENTQYGKYAKSAQFSQDYEGGSYGATKLYGVGMGHMYLQ